MIPEKMMEVLGHEGVVAIVTGGAEGPHVVNTWNSYIKVTGEGRILIPAGRMKATEANLAEDNAIQLTMGSREVEGLQYKGTGFLVEGKGAFLENGPDFDLMKDRYPWIRAVLAVEPKTITQTL